MIGNLTTALASTLGNSTSYVPLLVKDVANSAGLTYFSYEAGGKIEGKDRFIDEFGTQIIWIAGLPFYKKIADFAIDKIFKFNSKIDLRVVKDSSKEVLDWKIKNAPTKEIANSIKHIRDNLPTYKALTASKTIFATVLTLGSYLGLTKFRHKHTKTKLQEEYLESQKLNEKKALKRIASNKNVSDNSSQISQSYSKLHKHNSPFIAFVEPSFKGNLPAKIAEDIIFNPVKNLMIVDAGITAERLITSRQSSSTDPKIKNLERIEYAVKEGSFWAFLYLLAKPIEKGINKLTKKITNIPMELNAKVMADGDFQKALKNGNLALEINNFSKTFNSDIKMLDYIQNNKKSILVSSLEKSSILNFDKSGKINWGNFVNLNEIKSHVNNIKEFIPKNKNIDYQVYFKKAQTLKIGGIFANIGFSCLALGVIAPKMIYGLRKKIKGNTDSNFALNQEDKNKLNIL